MVCDSILGNWRTLRVDITVLGEGVCKQVGVLFVCVRKFLEEDYSFECLNAVLVESLGLLGS